MGSGFKRRAGGSKNLPYFSHEFIIQNHGDIITCIFMVFIVGLMFQVTAPLASSFIAPKYNLSDYETTKTAMLFTYGFKDIALVVFYSLAAIIFHAIIQEYILDKLVKKTKLSKTKTAEFNESGQLASFYLVSLGWLIYIFKEEGYFKTLDFFYAGYPHVAMTVWTKLFFIIQMSYWVHVFPEFYFQKTRREEIASKSTFAILNIFVCLTIYLLNLSRVGLTLMFIEYLINFLFHASRVVHSFGRSKFSKAGFNAYNLTFFIGRSAACVLAVFVFWFGLKSSSIDRINFEEKNFNTALTRYTCLFIVFALQLFSFYDYFSYLFKRRGDKSAKAVPKAKLTKKAKVASSRETSDAEGDNKGDDADQQSDVSPPPSPNGKVKAN